MINLGIDWMICDVLQCKNVAPSEKHPELITCKVLDCVIENSCLDRFHPPCTNTSCRLPDACPHRAVHIAITEMKINPNCIKKEK